MSEVVQRGWSQEKIATVRGAFLDFLEKVTIDSRESGETVMTPFRSQMMFIDAIFQGLSEDKHDFTYLKARQLGLSTISYLFTIFWVFVFPATKGAVVFDTDANKEAFRTLLKRSMESLPKKYQVGVTRDHRYELVLENGSTLAYMVAGTRKSKGSGGLGRSRGLNFCHCTETSSWGDIEGVRSLQRSFAQKNPDRIFIWESTARGYNVWHDLWEEAKVDPAKVATFIGWWARDDYILDQDDPLFERYGKAPPTVDEQKKIDEVKENYGWQITQEQLAWFRHQMNPGGSLGHDDDDTDIDEIISQELPTTAEDAFVLTGSHYFPPHDLTRAMNSASAEPFKGYRYYIGEDFWALRCDAVNRNKDVMLKVWEEPDDLGVYVVAADSAFASGPTADNYCAVVLRAYADGWDQVAEFHVKNIIPYQFTWVLAHMCGVYRNARLMLEVNGPGEAVLTGFQTLKLLVQSGYMREEAEKRGVANVFSNIRNYMWRKADSLSSSGGVIHWKTSGANKETIFAQFRDSFVKGEGRIRSVEALKEMQTIVQDGTSVEAEGNKKDDRVIALCLANRAWIDGERRGLIGSNRTRDMEQMRSKLTPEDINRIFFGSIVEGHLRGKDQARQRLFARTGRERWGRRE